MRETLGLERSVSSNGVTGCITLLSRCKKETSTRRDSILPFALPVQTLLCAVHERGQADVGHIAGTYLLNAVCPLIPVLVPISS